MAKHKTAPAAKFLLAIAAIIVLILIAGVIFTSNQTTMMRWAFVPSHEIATEQTGEAPDYTDEAAWAARPGISTNALLLPEGIMQTAMVPEADVFYIHPTTYLSKDRWNAPLDGDEAAVGRRKNFALKYQASAFGLAGQVYAPKYRQAAFGAFFDDSGQGVQALMRAHADVLAAFDHYIASDNKGRPFILAGHSQGSLHALLLLAERIAVNPELQSRMIAAYIIGWPVSIEGDLGTLNGIEPCEAPRDTGCVVSFQSFAKDGDPAAVLEMFAKTPGLNGKAREGTTMLCSNPLTWHVGGKASREANLGGVEVIPGADGIGAPIKELTGARCGQRGILYLNEPPQGSWREFLMTGDNYHAYDYNLFYMNIRANAAKRAQAWLEAHR
ncbi:DUF3089 domain-containing protein [Kordiimonas aestuarii]|uniref:DUF3089 domain-containing protein n=1 Tax=Kordiimonas aestuarii TaxID=1005925 RepID=UPI0021D188A2|nr:DUF3089 domain-containing protein [Kordiimonas aestuarii]